MEPAGRLGDAPQLVTGIAFGVKPDGVDDDVDAVSLELLRHLAGIFAAVGLTVTHEDDDTACVVSRLQCSRGSAKCRTGRGLTIRGQLPYVAKQWPEQELSVGSEV